MTENIKGTSQRKAALGKGLNSLLGLGSDYSINNPLDNQSQIQVPVLEVPIASVKVNPKQPRKIFHEDELEALANSIKLDGIMQPLIVTRSEGGGYLLVAGERRWRASQRAGLKSVPVLVKEVTPDDMLRLAVIENVQRSDLNVIEEAEAYATLIADFGLTQEECAQKVGKDRATITNILRMLQLPKEVQEDLFAKRLSMGHGRALLSLEDATMILKARDLVIKKQLSVRQTELIIKKIKAEKGPFDENSVMKETNRDLEYLADNLRSHLRTKVRLNGTGSRGKIEISYFSAAELERILKMIGGKEMGF